MIHTGSLLEPARWFGKPVAISRSQLRGKPAHPKIKCLAPSKPLLDWWKKEGEEANAWDDYKTRYWAEMKSNWSDIKEWLDSLIPQENITLLCWEKDDMENFHCHRQLVMKLIERERPEVHWKNTAIAPTDVEASQIIKDLSSQVEGYEIGAISCYDTEGKPESSLPLISENGKDPVLHSWASARSFLQMLAK